MKVIRQNEAGRDASTRTAITSGVAPTAPIANVGVETITSSTIDRPKLEDSRGEKDAWPASHDATAAELPTPMESVETTVSSLVTNTTARKRKKSLSGLLKKILS
jgi:hypothetical protein